MAVQHHGYQGALTYHFWPKFKTFNDDRMDYYEDVFYSEHCLKVTRIGPDWAKVLDDLQIDSAIINITALATLMTLWPNWGRVYEEEKTHKFFRKSR